MWRIKNNEEFLAEGWKKRSDGGFEEPASAPVKVCYVGQMIDIAKELDQDQIKAILALPNQSSNCRGYNWHMGMFIEDAPLVPLCGCAWNKHPLFCRCK